jgi:energy-coupling factor transporter ATP-binding protein EcfA2
MGSIPLDSSRWSSTEGMVLCENGTIVHVSHGRDVVVDVSAEQHRLALRLFLLGPVMAVLVHQRGMLPLHASAIAMDGQVYAFLGASGVGKSTLAAALNRRGHTVVADDVLAVEFEADGKAKAHTAFKELRISPAAAAAIDIPTDALPTVARGLDERLLYEADEDVEPDGGQPLHAAFVLADGPTHRVRRLEGGEAFREVERHSYVNREMLKTPGTMHAHFLCCARLMQSARVYRLQRPRSLTELSTTVKEVEAACAVA